MLKGVVRIEQLRQAEDYIEAVLARVKPEYIQKHYGLLQWEDATDFLEQYARKIGKLLKGAEPDTNAAAKLVLHHFQRGKLPYFTMPPGTPAREAAAAYAAPEEGKVQDAGGEGGKRVGRLEAPKQSLKQLVTTHKFDSSDLQNGANEDDEDQEGDSEEEEDGEEGDEGEEGEEEGSEDDEDGEDDAGEEDEPEPAPPKASARANGKPAAAKQPAAAPRARTGVRWEDVFNE